MVFANLERSCVLHLTDSSQGDPASSVIWRRPPLTTYDCDAAYGIAQRWIKTCVDDHSQCSQKMTAPFPTRLIDVGSTDREPSLYISSLGEHGIYVALSYCWGIPKQSVMLNRVRLVSKDHTLPLSELPPTLRDVILICRRLSFQYVWIDALCIVQDSINGEDWLKESAKMPNIYGGAALTISASAARQISDGVLSTSFVPTKFSCALPYNLGNGKIGAVYVVPYKMRLSPFVSKEVPEPLETRAWCLQERLLSPRILKFETSQLVWECFSTKLNANGPTQSPSDLSKKARVDWKYIIQDFTGRNLTYTSDKLPALSGYARHIHSLTGDTYLAGLWKNEIMSQLLWWINIRSTTINPRPSTYRAPSWSWASTDFKCYFMDFSQQSSPLQPDIKLFDASVPTFPSDSFGQVDPTQRGYLRIRGPLMSRARGNTCYMFHSENSGRYVTLCTSAQSPPADSGTHPLPRFVSPQNKIETETNLEIIGSIYPDSWEEMDLNTKATGPISILRITKNYGLLLATTSMPGFSTNVFQRLGLFEMRWIGKEMEIFGNQFTLTTITII